ncbi:MAG: neutral zinc metallopeptidase [Ahrensia sp.]|nr:neutral zinc metallopeptidase [Ahrensia sp.]
MRLDGRRRSSNVEDVRAQRTSGGIGGGGFGFPTGGGGRVRIPQGGRAVRSSGGGLSGIIMLVILFFVLRSCGIDPLQILAGGGAGGAGGSIFDQMVPQTQTQTQSAPRSTAATDKQTEFVSQVLAQTEDIWDGIFQANGGQYPKPTLVLFSGAVRSACGNASAASGPFYCPGDSKLYIDLSFFDELERKFGAGGDFAQAYVVAHEIGHHVQNVIGVLPRFNEMRRRMSQEDANAMSIRVELQADCFAGVWGYYQQQKGILEEGDIEEALNAATQIGDDTIQKRTQGFIVPESFNHGTSKQRRDWFYRGFKTGQLEACDTFNGDI